MRFHTFGNKENKKMILIHGVLTPWQIWQESIDYFSENYYVIVPALDGHIEEEASEYRTVEDEAERIIEYMLTNFGNDVDTICGLSMGGAIAYKIFESGKLNINYLVLDGAPLSPVGKLPVWIMEKSYISIIHKSKARDKKTLESFKKDFLPEKYLESFLKFADTMSDSSISNIVRSVFSISISTCEHGKDTSILFMHGTKGNESVSAKSAKRMKEIYPQTQIRCFEGYKHAELAIYHSKDWIECVDKFISGGKA